MYKGSLGKVAFRRVTDFTTGKFAQELIFMVK